MDKVLPPVVTAKPVRGREMKSHSLNPDMMDTMRLVSARKTLIGENLTSEIEKPRDAKVEAYHEGYVDGVKYYVPDSNLEAMKDIINFKMNPRRSIRYKHQTSFELPDYDHFRGKIRSLIEKLDEVEPLGEEEEGKVEEEEKTEDEVEEEEKVEDEVEEEEEKVEEEEQVEEEEEEERVEEIKQAEEEDVEEEEEQVGEEENVDEEKPPPKVEEYVEKEPTYLRFLVSGHFRKNQKPLYIIQDYDGEPDLFKDHKAEFLSHKKDGNVDINMKGKFYNENILEEINNKPVALSTKPEKIKIEKDRSRLYYEYFTETFKMKNVDISLRGEFIRNNAATRITPFVTLGVIKKTSPKRNRNPTQKEDKTNISNSQTVMVADPKHRNPFTNKHQHSITSVEDRSMSYCSLYSNIDESCEISNSENNQSHFDSLLFSSGESKTKINFHSLKGKTEGNRNEQNLEIHPLVDIVQVESSVNMGFSKDNLKSDEHNNEETPKTAQREKAKRANQTDKFINALKGSFLYKSLFKKKICSNQERVKKTRNKGLNTSEKRTLTPIKELPFEKRTLRPKPKDIDNNGKPVVLHMIEPIFKKEIITRKPINVDYKHVLK